MRISGVLALFPVTIVATFFVLQQQVELSRPFERHGGAYTDVGHLFSALKHAGKEAPKKEARPQTLPLRPKRQALPQQPVKTAPIIIAKNDEVVKTLGQTAQGSGEALLEQIWQDHVSQKQAAAEEMPELASASSSPLVASPLKDSTLSHGLMSPVMQQALAQADSGQTKNEFGKSLGEESDLARLAVLVLSARIGETAQEIDGVDFTTHADASDIVSDDKGRFSFEYFLSSGRQRLAGTFSAKGHVPTRVELPLEVGSYGSLVPLMSIESMDAFLRQLNITAPGGFILVDLDEQIIDVEIDRTYQYKAYLDANMKPSEADDSARFALFLGVNPGNVMLRYLTRGREIVERVSLVVADEILFDLPLIEKAQTHSFGLFEMESLSLMPRELTLSGRDIRPFNRKNTAVQDTLNFYSLELASSVLGARKYTEIDHLGTTFFVGHHGGDRLVIPGQGFLNEILAFHQLDRLERDCLIQINLPNEKEVLEARMLGEGADGPLALDESYLNRDGTVSMEATEFSTHAFVLGDMQGVINMRFDYVDGSVDFLTSYCAAGTYLVEHL